MRMIATGVLIWFFVTILMMGLFAGMEMAFFSVNKLVVEIKRKQGKAGATLLSRFVEAPVYFVGTTLIGYTLFLVFFVLLFNKVTQPLWNLIGLHQYEALRLVLDIAIATFIVMIFAEFIPRAIFRSRSNILLTPFIWVINFFYQILQPIAAAFIGFPTGSCVMCST
jgi:CBS domain containing-hemolysin-like protein